MAEVLKHGKNYATIDCPRCEATIGYTGADVTSYTAQEEFEGKVLNFGKSYIQCPECGIPIVIGGGVEEIKAENDSEE